MEAAIKAFGYDKENPGAGGTNLPERLLLYSLVRLLKPTQVIEVGVSRGHSTEWIAAALKDNVRGGLYAVDNWSGESGGREGDEESASYRLEQAGHLGTRVAFVSANSHRWLKKQKPDSVGIVWIDGDHTYEGALEDIRDANRVATELIIVHDVRTLPEVRRACQTIAGGVYLMAERGFWLRNPWR